MLDYVLWIAVVALACLAGAALFVLGWPGERLRSRLRFGSAVLAVVATAATATAAIAIYRGTFLADDQLPWLRWGIVACAAATFILIVRWLIGDRARGRRRCPKCWYDMSGTPVGGLTCPECGKAVRHEQGLLRARRRAWLLPAAFVPAVLGVFMWSAGFFRDPEWASRLPNSALALAAPFSKCDTKIAGEIRSSIPFISSARHPREYTAWQRWLLVQTGRRAQADTADSNQAFYGIAIMLCMQADDADTTAALIRLSGDANQNVVEAAAVAMSGVRHDLPGARAALNTVITDAVASRNADLAEAGVIGLLGIQRRDPGGPVPSGVIQLATVGVVHNPWMVMRLLGWFDPCDESRRILLASAAGRRSLGHATASLAALWPEDAEVQRLVLEALQDQSRDPLQRLHLVAALGEDDERMRECLGRLSESRLKLYTPEVCQALDLSLAEMRLYEADTPTFKWAYNDTIEALEQTLGEVRAAHAKR